MASEEATSRAIWQETVLFINKEFGKNLENLPKAPVLYEQVKNTKETYEKLLMFASTEAPSVVQNAVQEAEDTSSAIHRLAGQEEQLTGEVNLHVAEVTGMVKKLEGLTEQIHMMEQCATYLQVIVHFQDLSSNIQSALIINSVERAVAQFSELAELAKKLQSSQCRHLVNFMNETVMFWYGLLKDKLSGEFAEVLKAYYWPFIVSTAKPAAPVANVAEVKGKLAPLFSSLLQLQLPDGLDVAAQAQHPVLSLLPNWNKPVLPLQLMLLPLKKRFRFHFTGKKQTNTIEKPEWYFTLILTWLKDHRGFLTSHIQPLMDKAGMKYTTAMVEFSRGLVMLVLEKMHADISEMVYDEHIFSHFIDETLTFDRQLRTVYGYPSSQPGPLHVLVQDHVIDKWILIEKKFALEKMDDMFSRDTAWQSQYKDVAEVMERQVPECCEAFITLLLTITERYKPLPSAGHRVRFVDLQLELLDDYRIRLLQIRHEASQDPLSSVFLAILNTVNYIAEVLNEWKDLDFFVLLQYHKNQESRSVEESKHEDSVLSSSGSPRKKPGLFASLSTLEEPSFVTSTSVFDDMIAHLEYTQNDMLANAVLRFIMDDVKARSMPYRRDKWLALPSQKELFSLDLSSTACEMFFILKSHLTHTEAHLNKALFQQLWPKIASQLNRFIYGELILQNHFNDGGGAQLNFDMTRNLFPLFGLYTPKPENYFKDVKEACIVLTLSAGTAMLLKGVLYDALHNPKSDPKERITDPISALQEHGIFKLEPEDAELILSRRTNLTT